MRLAKYLARSGVDSRRRAEEMIAEGRVCINGIIIGKPQTLVQDNDLVTVDGKPVEGFEQKTYLLLHKPAGYISTVRDTHNRPTVMDLVKGEEKRLYPVGRLDADTSGVLLMTNDGELSHRLTHPSFEVEKKYLARVSGIPGEKALNNMRRGVLIEGHKTASAKVELAGNFEKENESLLEITLIEGKKRQVKKMCEAINHPVVNLHRQEFAGLKAESVREGTYRHLTSREIKALYRLVKL